MVCHTVCRDEEERVQSTVSAPLPLSPGPGEDAQAQPLRAAGAWSLRPPTHPFPWKIKDFCL